MNLRAIKTVYSYYLPEIRQIVTDLTRKYPHEIFLNSLGGNLDDFEQPVIDKLVRYREEDLPDLGQFPCRYPTAGAEEGIREFLTMLQSRGENRIYMLAGDYEGFRDVAATRNIATIEVGPEQNPARLKPGYWFISNPSARNGNHLPDGLIHSVCEAGHKVFYDMSYLGTTAPRIYRLDHPNIVAVAISFSKPYGLFYYRIGFLFTRKPVPALYANKWFKSIFGLLIAEKILDKIAPWEIAGKYKAIQRYVVSQIERECGLQLQPSHSFLLAHVAQTNEQITQSNQEALRPFLRGEYYRFCLTPYFLEYEKSLRSP